MSEFTAPSNPEGIAIGGRENSCTPTRTITELVLTFGPEPSLRAWGQ